MSPREVMEWAFAALLWLGVVGVAGAFVIQFYEYITSERKK